jgi:uncharacterized protein (DUF4415 family)
LVQNPNLNLQGASAEFQKLIWTTVVDNLPQPAPTEAMTKDVSRGVRGGKPSAPTGNASAKGSRTEWSRPRAASDAEVRAGIKSDVDAHATDAAFWKDAKVVWPTPKQVVTMRLDADLLEWLRQERGYQTRVNAILRAYMDAQKNRA